MFSCILSQKVDDLNMTLLKNGLTSNLPCEQVTHEYSFGKRNLWFLSGCPCEYYMILNIIET